MNDDKHDVILDWAERVREASEEATPGPWAAAFGEADGPSVFTSAKQEPVVTEVLANNGWDSRFIALLGPHIAALVADVVRLGMEHMATLDDYRGGLDDEDPEYVGESYEAVLDVEYRYKKALDRLNAELEHKTNGS